MLQAPSVVGEFVFPITVPYKVPWTQFDQQDQVQKEPYFVINLIPTILKQSFFNQIHGTEHIYLTHCVKMDFYPEKKEQQFRA